VIRIHYVDSERNTYEILVPADPSQWENDYIRAIKRVLAGSAVCVQPAKGCEWTTERCWKWHENLKELFRE
jgi:hypothetical protein